MNTDKPKAPLSDPGWLLFFLSGTIFATELLLMVVFTYITDWPLWLETILDASFLVIIIFPVINRIVITPLHKEIDLQRAEQLELRKQSTALNAAANAIFITDTDGVIQWVNPAFTALTGFSPEETTGKTPRILKSGKMPADYYRRLWASIVKGDTWHSELINRHKSGYFYTIDQIITPVKNDTGTVTNYVAIQNDISRRVQAEEATRREKVLDETILASIGDGLILMDQEGKVIRVNRTFETLTGYVLGDFAGKKFVDVAAAKDASGKLIPREKRLITRVQLESQRTLQTKYTLVRKDGSTLDVSVIVSPVILEGTYIGAVQVYRDITQEQAVDRAKSEFVSMASHQLRTPLSTIKWYAEILLAGDLGMISDKQKEYLTEIAESNTRMISLVNNLLNVSRIETGILQVDPEDIRLPEIADSILHELEPVVSAKHVDVRKIYADNIPPVFADPKLVRMVFQNILTNAVKYTEANGTVSVSLHLGADGIHFDVTDTGMGIPKDAQERIFTKLYRADNARSMEPDGNGLGLYIVKSILDQTGGTVRFTSEEGKGTTFYVTLPLSGMKPRQGTRSLA